MHDYRLQAGWEAGEEKPREAMWGEGYGDLTDEMIEYIEQRNALCRGCRKRNCGECEV